MVCLRGIVRVLIRADESCLNCGRQIEIVYDFPGLLISRRNKIFLEVYRLANIKSAKKRILVIEKKTLRNKSIKSRVKTAIKKVDAAVLAGDKAAAEAALPAAISEISKAATKGVYHKNTASRKISRLTKAVNKLA